MFKRIGIWLGVVFVFISILSYMHFVSIKLIPIKKDHFQLISNGVGNPYRPVLPMFYYNENQKGQFFIHPATSLRAKGDLSFDKKGKYKLCFSVQNRSPVGKVAFEISKDGELVKQFVLAAGDEQCMKIKILKDQFVHIEADALGLSAGDWGSIKVEYIDRYYEFSIVLLSLLWSAFVLFLVSRGYVYVAIFTTAGLILALFAEYITFGPLTSTHLAAYVVVFLFLGSFFVLLYQELRFLKKIRVVGALKLATFAALYLLFGSFVIYYFVFDKPIDWNILYAIFQTNPFEAKEFLQSFIPASYFFIAVILMLILLFGAWHQESLAKHRIDRVVLVFVVLLTLVLVPQFINASRIYALIDTTYEKYNEQIERFKRFRKQLAASDMLLKAKKEHNGEVYVLVIGESLNRFNMSLYTYFRDTTPRQIEARENLSLIAHDNAYANAGNTLLSLSYALTEANQYNGMVPERSPSIVDLFKKAGFETYWISTHRVIDGSPSLLSVIAQSVDYLSDLHQNIATKSGMHDLYDATTADVLKRYLEHKSDKNRLFVIHLYGNHFRYKDRYPKDFARFDATYPYMIGTDDPFILSEYTDYDNSVYYNDYVLDRILQVVRDYGGVACFMHFADHAEDIVRHKGHTAQDGGFTFHMIHIPLTFWCSEDYKKRYPKKYDILRSHRSKLFSNDLVYDTLVGISGINTDRYEPRYDLSSPHYRLTPQEARTLMGKIKYADPKNFYFWERANSEKLQKVNILKNLIIKNSDTAGKIADGLRLGYRAFHLQVVQANGRLYLGKKEYDPGGDIADLVGLFEKGAIERLIVEPRRPLKPRRFIEALQKYAQKIAPRLFVYTEDINFARQLIHKGFAVAASKLSCRDFGEDEVEDCKNLIRVKMSDYALHDPRLDAKITDLIEDLKKYDAVVVKMRSSYDR